MSEYRQPTPHYQGEGYDKGKPDPNPQPCPDPCDQKPPWGPPQIRPECCPERTCCPRGEDECCTWEEVDDPCVKASSAECGLEWTKIDCHCESSNPDCNCEVWDCGCYPPGTCVPCRPCEGLIPDPKEPPGGGCYDPGRDDCTEEDLRKQLDALTQCITSQQSTKAKLEADIKARNERADALKELIKLFPDIVKKYKEQRHKLVCREDCLKGFHRDITTVFSKYSPAYLDALRKIINAELCKLEMLKCCQKNLDGKLTKVTKLKWKQQEAEKALNKANQALAIIKDLPQWIDDRFKELEGFKDEIDQALNDPDPQKHKWAFYVFYWKYVPKLCKCFPFPFCCEKEGSQYQQGEQPVDHLGCKPGDWHPSAITEDTLRALICCAWDYARQKKQEFQDISDVVADVTNNLAFITKKVDEDGTPKALDDRIKSGLDKAGKQVPTSR